MEGQAIERTTAKDKKLKRRRWQLRVFLGYDSSRKQKFKFETYVGTETGMKARLKELVVQQGKGELHQETSLTVSEYLKAWADSALAGSVSARTAQDYKGLLDRHIEPEIGHVKLARLSPLQVQAVYKKMREAGLSARTIRYAHTVFNRALRKAVDWHYISRNPASAAELPKKQRREARAMSVDDVKEFLKAAKGTRFEPLWHFALDTGMRPEEYLALRWSDIEGATVRVRRAVTRKIKGGGYHFIEPKTPQARRSIPMGKATVKLLERHRANQRKQRLAFGPEWKNLDLVFPNHRGEPMDGDNLLLRYFKPLLEKAKINSPFNVYTLRHTCATLLLSAGVNPKVVAERLGHSSITITLDTYSHVLPGIQEAASDALAALIYGKR